MVTFLPEQESDPPEGGESPLTIHTHISVIVSRFFSPGIVPSSVIASQCEHWRGNPPRHTHVIARAAVPPDNAHQHVRNRFPILFARYRSFHCHCEGACARGNPPIRICRGRCPHRPGKPQACAMLRIAGRMKASAPTMSNAPSSHPLSLRGGEADVAISRHSSTNSPKTCVRRIVRRRLPRRSFRPPRNDMLF